MSRWLAEDSHPSTMSRWLAEDSPPHTQLWIFKYVKERLVGHCFVSVPTLSWSEGGAPGTRIQRAHSAGSSCAATDVWPFTVFPRGSSVHSRSLGDNRSMDA
ncbi:hypothetical protein RRG08_003321, partial [Elysia crispata]